MTHTRDARHKQQDFCIISRSFPELRQKIIDVSGAPGIILATKKLTRVTGIVPRPWQIALREYIHKYAPLPPAPR
jgi:hypothetical protein